MGNICSTCKMPTCCSKKQDQEQNQYKQNANTDTEIKIEKDNRTKFSLEGLGKGAAIFNGILSSSKNTEPSANQTEDYNNTDLSTYKPGYYSIIPKPINTQCDAETGNETVEIICKPETDPLKAKHSAPIGYYKVNYGFSDKTWEVQDSNSYYNIVHQKVTIRTFNNYDPFVFEVNIFLFFEIFVNKLSSNLFITIGPIKDHQNLDSMILFSTGILMT